jgi:hypothetical protein
MYIYAPSGEETTSGVINSSNFFTKKLKDAAHFPPLLLPLPCLLHGFENQFHKIKAMCALSYLMAKENLPYYFSH